MVEGNKTKNPLVGKFVFYDGGEFFRTGQIVDVVADAYLIQFDCMADASKANWKFPMELVHVSELLSLTGDNRPWGFFDSRDGLNKFLAWANTPAKKEAHGKVLRPSFGNGNKE